MPLKLRRGYNIETSNPMVNVFFCIFKTSSIISRPERIFSRAFLFFYERRSDEWIEFFRGFFSAGNRRGGTHFGGEETVDVKK